MLALTEQIYTNPPFYISRFEDYILAKRRTFLLFIMNAALVNHQLNSATFLFNFFR